MDLTKIQYAGRQLSTYIPQEIVNQFNLKKGEALAWDKEGDNIKLRIIR